MEKWSINQNWNFFKISSDNIEQIIHTTALGENVDLPHTWYHEDEEPPYRGGVFYTKTIKKEAGWNHVYIDIPAADQYAKIWVNGCYAGEHKGGYSGFRVEVPSRAMEEEFLTLQIYVSNALREDISPLAGDFTIYGGLYRGINLMVSGDIHFDYLYYGTDKKKLFRQYYGGGSIRCAACARGIGVFDLYWPIFV